VPKNGGADIFEDAAELRPEDGARLVAALSVVSGARLRFGRSTPSHDARSAVARATARMTDALAAPALRGAAQDRWSLPRSAALDFAAELVELSEQLHRCGHVVEAFALEGIEARVVEALLGGGPLRGS
jgi:hypothetical protein